MDTSSLTGFNSPSSKILTFFIKNKKIIKIWFLLIFSLLFFIGFALYLYTGIGNEYTGKDIVGDGPSRNGVWFIEPFINNKPINGQIIKDWADLSSAFNDSFHRTLHDFLNMALNLHNIFVAVTPIWIVGLVFIMIYLIFWLLWKFVFKKLIEKKLSSFFTNDHSKQPNKISDDKTYHDLPDQIKQAISEIENNVKSTDNSNNNQ